MNDLEVRVLFEEGNRLMSRADAAGAERCYRDALTLDPDIGELHSNLAMLLQDRGDLDGSEASFRRAIELQPDHARHRVNFAQLLIAERRIDEAEACLCAALEIEPGLRPAWTSLGVLLASVKRDDQAERCFRTALAIEPEHRLTRFNSSYLLLRQGRFEEGWAALEARDWYAGLESRLPMPRWQGQPLHGRSLLIGFEAGHGDMIQLSRYAAVLKRQGAGHIGMLCHPPLKRLFETLEGVDELIGFDEALPDRHWDFWTPPFSIAFHCGTRLDTIPAPIPYLRARSGDSQAFAAMLPPRSNGRERRIGLVWKGSPAFENDAERSLPSLDVLAPLAVLPDIRWFSLQKGAGESEALDPPEGLRITALGDELHDFADTAAAITQMDLVITVDTAVAHLAGAMGRPCWVLLPFLRTDWRWLDGRTDSPWYPIGMRLFRQGERGAWASVVRDLKVALEPPCILGAVG